MSGSRVITFAVPCYNSAQYMDKCIKSLLVLGDDIEIIIIDDGSMKDDTPQKADDWQKSYPDVIRVIHKENGGHGSAVNVGLDFARGRYFKVVDSDDWLDASAMAQIMEYLRLQSELQFPTDLVIGNYVYEKVHENTRNVMHYRNVFPQNREFGWGDIRRFRPSQYLLMHSVIYRTDLLREIGLLLPEHCFYVDNIFVYVPLPHVKTMRYFDVDMYRYFIGREDQSVNESVMMSRIDQQLRVTRKMIDAVKLPEDISHINLLRYMQNYLSMMMCICSVFLRMQNTSESEAARIEIWNYLLNRDPVLYKHIRMNILNAATNIPTPLGRKVGVAGYHLAQKIFKFN